MRKWPTGLAGISLAIALAGRNDHAICADTYIYIYRYVWRRRRGLRWALDLGRGLPGAIDDLSVDP